MQSVKLNTNFTDNIDSAVYSSKCESLDELSITPQQLARLKQTVLDLENSIRIKDSQMESMRRDNERLVQELRKQQRNNRSIKQQLNDERFLYQKEKEHLYEEMQTHKEKCLDGSSKFHRLEFERIRSALEDENKKLKDELFEKSQTTYNLCIKFLKMKLAKDNIRQKLDQLTKEHLQVMSEMMEKLDEAREELNIIVSKKFQDPLPMSKAKYLQIVKRNSRLVHENAVLKLQVQHLIQNVEKLRSETEKSKTVNIDAKTIEKLIERNRSSRRQKDFEMILNPPSREKIETRKSSNVEACRAVDQSGDAKLISKLRAKHCNKIMETETVSKSHHDKLFVGPGTSCTQSASAILQKSTLQQFHFIIESGNMFERTVEVRNIGTNT